jgi:hypothetical protein
MEASARVVVPGLRLGKLAPKYDSRTLRMARYVKPDLLAAPPVVNWATKMTLLWGMLGNDTLGDCTCAALGHMDQVWALNTGRSQDITDDVVCGKPNGLYWRTGTEDKGRNMLDVLKEVVRGGFAGDKYTAFASLDPRNHLMHRYVVWQFGGVYLGITLPVTAQNQAVWDYVPNANGNEPGSWGGHAVNVVAYDDAGITIVTWGAIKKLTWSFVDHYCDEAFAIISPDWFNSRGRDPNGFNMAALRADLAVIH